MSELVALRKTLIPQCIAAIIFGLLVGLAGLILSTSEFFLALAGLIIIAAALAKVEFALALLVVAVPLTSVRINLGPIPIDAVTFCTGLVIASYAIKNLGRRIEGARTPFTWSFLVFLFFSAVSMVVAPSLSEAALVIVRFIGYFLLVLIVGQTVKSKETLTWLLILMVVAGAATGLFGIYQYLYAPDTAKIGLYDLTEDVAARVGSTFGNPNFYAEYLVLMIPIGLALVLGLRGIFRRTYMAAATLLLFVGLILTYTRGSWMATGIGIVLMSLLTETWLFWVWAALFAAALIAAPGVASRLASITDITGGTAGFRMKLWRIASGIIREHPLVGIGIGNYYEAFTEYVFRNPKQNVGWVMYGAHNSYLTIWAETGIFGILSFVLIILVSIKYGLYIMRVKAKDKYLAWINSAILAGIIGFSLNGLTSNSFHHPQGAVFFWIFLGLQVAISNLIPEPAKARLAPVVEGSLILRPFRTALISLKAAVHNHPLYRFTARLNDVWCKSSIAIWLYREPSVPNFAGGSRVLQYVNNWLEQARAWYENSSFHFLVKETAARPVMPAIVFILIAVSARSLLKVVV
ncbi:MAG: O-antigen ligase family protein [Actinomycetota bacterium]|nr:O-antigen ligase family protein [Actinomycetota bacterium]